MFYGWGLGITILFGMFTAGLVYGAIETSDWWNNLRNTFFNVGQ